LEKISGIYSLELMEISDVFPPKLEKIQGIFSPRSEKVLDKFLAKSEKILFKFSKSRRGYPPLPSLRSRRPWESESIIRISIAFSTAKLRGLQSRTYFKE
jgi:hypothetical protein